MINESIAGTIPVSEAAERTQRWREATNGVQAFSFEIDEFYNLIDSLKHQNPFPVIGLRAIRFYLGITQEGIPSLMMVPVVGDYDPSLQKGGTDVLTLNVNGVNESVVFDFSCPCPYTCSEKNELNTNPPTV